MSDSIAPNIKIDLVQSIKEWLFFCDSQHTATRAQPCLATSISAQLPVRPSWLTDVDQQCIVPGDVRAEYLALSYTWQDNVKDANETEQLQLQGDNVGSLGHLGALTGHLTKIPKVILDTMDLTMALGKRYLWVDRLCIIQDGPQKKTEIDRMDQVYEGAYAIIADAAKCGLYKTPVGTMSTITYEDPVDWIFFRLIRDEAELETLRVATNYKQLSQSRWAQRAWTYQEYILSKRVIFFVDEWVFWQCECAVWDLSHLQLLQNYKAAVMVPAMSNILKPRSSPTSSEFSLYADLICPYNGRELSHTGDGLSACSGILNRLASVFPDGSLFGLPRLYLDYALLWQPLHGCCNDVDPPTNSNMCGRYESWTGPSTRRPTLPSWTWCGWQCFVDPEFFNVLWIQRGDNNVAYRAGCGFRVLLDSYLARTR